MEFEKYMELLQKYKELCSGEIERRKLYDFQINILDEIVALENLVRENEAKIKEQKGRKANNRQEIIEISNSINLMKDNIFHLKGDIIRVKEIMDALAYTLFSKFDLKNLGFGENTGYISGKKGLEKELEVLEELLTNGKIAILNDLTNCIKCGDITEKSDDRINLIEVKTSNGKNYRIIRQENKRKEIMNYLHNDNIDNFYGKHFKRLYVEKQENYLVDLNDMIDCAITENIVIEKMEDGLYYSVMFRPEKKDMEKLQDIKREVKKPICFNLNVFKNSKNLTNNPFLNFFDDVIDYWNFVIGDLIILVIVDLAVLEERFKNEEMEVKLINEGIWKLAVEFNNNGSVDEIKVSEHYFNRIARDFLSLEYYINTIITVVKKIREM